LISFPILSVFCRFQGLGHLRWQQAVAIVATVAQIAFLRLRHGKS
jgi:hypothetical protein